MMNSMRSVAQVLILLLSILICKVSAISEEEFNANVVSDPRKEAQCHNFADNGAFYHLKIINGRIYYKRDNEFKGEFSWDPNKSSSVYLDYKTWRNHSAKDSGETTTAPLFDMIAARNNRAFAYSDIDKAFFWAEFIEEYYQDYPNPYTGIRGDVNGCYTKVDPQDDRNATNPTFWGDPNNHYATQGYVNYLPISKNNSPILRYLTKNGVFFSTTTPDLEDVSTTNYSAGSTGPIVGDAMQVKVVPNRCVEGQLIL
jgi:hypothetical protein